MSPQGGISSSFQMRDKCCREKAARHSGGREGGGIWGHAGRRAGRRAGGMNVAAVKEARLAGSKSDGTYRKETNGCNVKPEFQKKKK